MSIAKRFISTTRVLKFQKEVPNWFPLNNPTTTNVAHKKWAPTNGNSFRSFAEYRLKAINQSPLAVRSKATISTGATKSAPTNVLKN
ncbi:hypothetical protein CAAN1_01S05358 [[Candida] anglica]|uniref:Uncharacterized protein n=1 Tax=[Candida] anglica TaxID=148631 RepID=A0ABP0EN39_9ASCO